MTSLVGTPALLWLAIRRDRVLLPVWIGSLALMSAFTVRATIDLYNTALALRSAARGINDSPALVALYGPIPDETSLGAIAVFKLILTGGLFVGFLTALIVRRHTRVDEESGRAELLGGTVIGSRAILVAALAEATLAAVLVGVTVAVANDVAGLDSTGSWVFGAGWMGLGLVSAAIAAVGAQLSASARTGAGIVAASLGAAFLMRSLGDVAAPWLTWLSPIGWVSKAEPYAANRWWVVLLPVLLAGTGFFLALVLRDRRDLGSGVFPARPGLADGREWLGSVTALWWRLGRIPLVVWTGGLVLFGALLGGVAPQVGDMLMSERAREMFERLGGVGTLQDMFLSAEASIMAIVVTAYAITVVTRAAAEETDGRAELVLPTRTTRAQVFAATAGLAGAGATLLMLAFGLSASVSFGLQEGGVAESLGRVLPAAVVQLPAIWLVLALALAVWAGRARLSYLAWVILVVALVLGQLGELLGLPTWMVDLSPYSHVPRLPVEEMSWPPVLALTGLAGLVAAAAWWRYRARDIG
jgi:ABC-2 type transport system permease protein